MADIVPVARVDTRQCIIRVWLAISAVWTAFWLALAGVLLATPEFRHPDTTDFTTFCTIVLTPPIVLLGLAALAVFLLGLLNRPAGRGLLPH